MDKTKCNDKENEIFEKEREESCGLTFPVQHSGELFITFQKNTEAATNISLTVVNV